MGQPLVNLVLLKPSGGAIFQNVYTLDLGESKTKQFNVNLHKRMADEASGHVLPLQLIYEGKTDLNTPGGKPKIAKSWQPLPARVAADAAGHDVTATPSHWATEDSHKKHFERVILLDYKRSCTELGHNLDELPVAQWPFMIYQLDVYAVHRKRTVLEWFNPLCTSSSCRLAPLLWPRCFIQDSVQQIASQLDAGTAAEDTKLDLSGKYLKPLSLVWAGAAHQHNNGMSDLVLNGYKNAGTLRAFDDSYQRAAMTEMGRLFEVPILDPVLKVPQLLQVFEDEQNADAVEDDAAVEANDLEAALLARPALKPLLGMVVPMEDCPLLTEQVAGIDVQSMTAVNLMVAAQQWSAITRAMPVAKPSVKPAAATADGPPIRKRGRPLGSKNEPKPTPIGQAMPTPTRKQARLVCNTSSSANNSSANTSSAGNSSGDDGSNDDGSASSEGWVGSKLAAGVAGCKKLVVGVVGMARAAAGVAGRTRSASGVAGQTGATARVASRTKSATGVFALAKAASWVTTRARKFECSEEDAEICRHCKQPQEHHDFMGEVQCPI
ncbi:hypothetical protein QJQ45_006342 [Haematococcus lacustris]|nr:hypothetical protein QJQ45_006342 [Haematococcus lacustris]